MSLVRHQKRLIKDSPKRNFISRFIVVDGNTNNCKQDKGKCWRLCISKRSTKV